MAHGSGPQAENDIAENGHLYRRRTIGQIEFFDQDLTDCSRLYVRRIPDSCMVAILTGSVSQANCATFLTNRLSPKGNRTGGSTFMDGFPKSSHPFKLFIMMNIAYLPGFCLM